ncbi:ZN574 protein, partial [Lophotis ruficrista]|nr:ZN574 protein [Lophotis ruficrista]
MSQPPEEPLLLVEHRYVCSECSHLSATLEDALLHQQNHLGPQPPHRYELVGFAGDFPGGPVPEGNQYQCLECGQLLVSPGQLLEHQEMHIKLLGQEAEGGGGGGGGLTGGTGSAGKAPPAGQIHYECVECKALFSSQELWLAHRQSHRAEAAAAPQNQALVRREHSYRKHEEEEEEEEEEGSTAAAAESGATLQLLLYECGECLQLFQTPKDFLEHQAAHFALNGPANEAPPPPQRPREAKSEEEEEKAATKAAATE